MRRLECVARRERHRPDLRPLARRAQVRLRADADHADPADVTLEQRVHRLRGRERDERDAPARLAEVAQQPAERLGDAFGDTGGSVVRGRNDRVCDEPQRRRLDRDGLREGAADVDADPERPAHAARRLGGRAPPPRDDAEDPDRADAGRRRAARPAR